MLYAPLFLIRNDLIEMESLTTSEWKKMVCAYEEVKEQHHSLAFLNFCLFPLNEIVHVIRFHRRKFFSN